MITDTAVLDALANVLSELIDGSDKGSGWVLNPGDRGLLQSLDKLSADQASAIPPTGGASIAAHTDHLRYGLSLMNRWSRGEQPFADANFAASWNRDFVSEKEWLSRRDSLRQEAYAWRDSIRQLRDTGEVGLEGLIATVAHLAYHVGAIRQIDRSLRGPSAND